MTSEPDGPPPTRLERPRTFTGLLGESALYAVGSLVGKVVGVLLLPIVSRSLTPAAFGRLDLLSTLSSSASAIGLLGVDFAATRLHPDLDEDDRHRLAGSWLVLAIGTVIPLALGSIALRRSVSTFLFDTPALGTSVGLVGVIVASTVLQLVGLTLLRSQGRPTLYAWISGGTLGAYGLLAVTFLALEPRVESVMWAYAISQSLGAAVALLASLSGRLGPPSRAMTARLIRLGFAALPAMAAVVSGDVLQRIVLLSRGGDAEVGYLSVAVRFGSVVLLGVVGFQLAWQPAAFNAKGAELRARLREGEHMLAMLAVMALGTAVVTPEAVNLVAGEEYRGAVAAVGYMLIFGLLYGVFQVVTMPSALAHRPGDISIAAVTGVATALGISLLVARHWGATGTAAAMAVGQGVAVVAAGWLAAQLAGARHDLRRLAWLSIAPAALIMAATVPDGGAPPAMRACLLVVGCLVIGASDPRLRTRTRSFRSVMAGGRPRP